MRVILYGGKFHGSILHDVGEDCAGLNHKGTVYRLVRQLTQTPPIHLFACTNKLDGDELEVWAVKLDDPLLFQGPDGINQGRKLMDHKPDNPHEHGMGYVMDCLKSHTSKVNNP